MGKKKAWILLVIPILAFLLVSSLVLSESQNGKATRSLNKTTGLDSKLIDVNKIAAWMSSDGILCSDPVTGQSGLYYPKGAASDHTVIYTAGLWVVGKIGGDIRSAAADYATEFQPGMILGVGGPPDNPADPKYKIFKFKAEDWDSPEMAADRAEAIAQGMEDKMYGDQMLYCVYNDYASHSGVWTKAPIGLEVQQLAFGYNRVGALGSTIFIKYTFINKGNDVLEDAYVAQFFDPDNGGASDDAVGCDTTLGIGYVYNIDSYDDIYGVEVPSFGCDFFQGPVVPSVGDTAYIPGQEPIPDHKVLQMTSFGPYINGGPEGMSDPSLQTAQGAQMAYWFCSGLKGNGASWLDPTMGDAVTVWPFYGDPVAGTGWIQEITWPGDDMRMSLGSGPFTLEIGVPYSVVVGYVVGQGKDNLNSIEVMKSYDKSAQLAYDLNFDIAKPAPYPEVSVAELDRQITLSWDNTSIDYVAENKVDLDTLGNPSYYNFEGFKLYQGKSLAGPWTLINQWDKVNGIEKIWDYVYDTVSGENIYSVVENGEDSGLTYSFIIDKDYINNVPLVNGRPYYFSITTYSYDEWGSPRVLENAIKAITVIPQKPILDTKYNAEVGDSLEVTVTGPENEGWVKAFVVDPSLITGHTYSVQIATTDEGESVWNLVDKVTGETKLANQTSFSGDEDYLVADGIRVVVYSPEYGLNLYKGSYCPDNCPDYGGFSFSGSRYISGVNWGGATFWGGLDLGENFFGSTLGPADYVNVRIDFWNQASNTADPVAHPWTKAYVYHRDQGYAYQGIGTFPGAAYDIDDPDNPRRINLCFVEDAREGVGIGDMFWDPVAPVIAGCPNGGREYLFIMKSDYADGAALYDDTNDGTGSDVLYAIWPNRRGSHTSDEEFNLSIWCNHPIGPENEYTYNTAGYDPNKSNTIAKARLEDINVFPNPYFASNKAETDFFSQFITFNNLPGKCTIRIFSLSGQMVRTIEHTNETPFERWDLNNENGLPVGSGIFITLIEVPNVGEKILKIAIVNREARYRHM